MPRALRLTERYRWTFERRGPEKGSAAAKRLGATLRSLADGPLPGPQDFEVFYPPVARYSCRRVTGANLWVVFTFGPNVVTVIALHDAPPVPIDPDE